MKKRTLIICLILIVLSSSVFFINIKDKTGLIDALFSSLSFSDSFDKNALPLSTNYFDTLNDKEKKAYINIYKNIKSHPEYIRIPVLSTKEFNNVFFAVKNDNPDILCFSDSCNMVSFFNTSYIQMEYIHDKEKCNNMMKELNETTDFILSEIKYETEFDKELYIHDYIVKNCEYSESENASNAYGCLIEKKAICSGYSRATMILLLKAGIKTTVISGTGITPTDENISHMWNIVWINNNAYHLDVTWDDPVSETEDYISHLFFNLNNNQISYDHIDLSINVQSGNINDNYFINQGLMFYDFNKSIAYSIADKLCDNIRNGNNFIELMFFDESSYLSAVDRIINSDSRKDELYIILSQLSENAGNMIDTSHVSFSKDDNRHYIRIMFDKI